MFFFSKFYTDSNLNNNEALRKILKNPEPSNHISKNLQQISSALRNPDIIKINFTFKSQENVKKNSTFTFKIYNQTLISKNVYWKCRENWAITFITLFKNSTYLSINLDFINKIYLSFCFSSDATWPAERYFLNALEYIECWIIMEAFNVKLRLQVNVHA
jgi:hypothetical protein